VAVRHVITIKGSKNSSGPTIEHGTYEAVLESVNAYTSDDFNTKQPKPSLTFVWNLGEDDDGNEIKFFDSYIELKRDGNGLPTMPGVKHKFYNRISALYGERFDPKADEFDDWEIVLPEAFDTPEGIEDLPHVSTLGSGGERVEVESLTLRNVELIGKECQIEIGNIVKPDGKKSDKTSVVSANPMPRKANKRTMRRDQPLDRPEAEEDLPL
jgi:hypothetical protein